MKKQKKAKKTHSLSKRHSSKRHNKIVSGVLAAALAFTVIVSSQISGFDSSQVSTDEFMNPPQDQPAPPPQNQPAPPPQNQPAPPPQDQPAPPPQNQPQPGPSGGSGTIPCQSLGGAMVTPAECDAADAQHNGGTGQPQPGQTSTYQPQPGTTGQYGTQGQPGTYQPQPGTTGQYGTQGQPGTYPPQGQPGNIEAMKKGCDSAKGIWHSDNNYCEMSGQNGQYGQNSQGVPMGNPQQDCAQQGGTLQGNDCKDSSGKVIFTMGNDPNMMKDPNMKDPKVKNKMDPNMKNFSKDGTKETMDRGNKGPMGPPPFMGTMPQCNPGEFYDFGMQSCKPFQRFDQFQATDQFDAFRGGFECPEWDTYCRDNQHKFGQEGLNFGEEFTDVQCFQNPNDISRMSKEIGRDVTQIERRFKEVDLSQLTDSSLAAEVKAAYDTLKTLSTSQDGCDVAKAGELRGQFFNEDGYMRKLDSVGQLSQFRKELSRISTEITREETRIKAGKGLDYLTRAKTLIANLTANPKFDPQMPWTLWDSLDPQCMKMGGGFPGGDFGPQPMNGPVGPTMDNGQGFGGQQGRGMGMPTFNCTDSELEGTVRGLLMLARKTADGERNERFQNNVCEDAKNGLGEAERSILPQLAAADQVIAKSLIERGKATVTACQADTDKTKYVRMFDKIRMEFEGLMAKSGIAFEDFEDEFGETPQFKFVNHEDLLGGDLEAKIQALIDKKVAEAIGKIQSEVERVLSEKLTEIATVLQQSVLDKMTSLFATINKDVADRLATGLEYTTYVPESGREAANTQQETVAEVVEQTENIRQIAEASGDDEVGRTLDELQDVISERPLPVAVLETIRTYVDSAETLARNGGDADRKIEEAIAYVDRLSDRELNLRASQEGTWQFVDVTPGVNGLWEGEGPRYTAQAFKLGVMEGTPVREKLADGTEVETRQANPDKVLNLAEGLTMIAKAGKVEQATPSAEVSRLVGDSTWAGPYIQGIADEVGLEKVRQIFQENGNNPAAPLTRENFADVSIALYESRVGDVSVDADATIGQYQDFGRMNADQRHDFAVAKKIGMITGADGGKTANFEGQAIRLEAAKMLSVFNLEMEEAQVLGDRVLIGDPTGGREFIEPPQPGREEEPVTEI